MRRLLGLIGTWVVVLSVIMGVPAVAQSAGYVLYVNGAIASDAYPQIRNGVAYLPANSLAQAMGADISWNSRLNVVTVNGQTVEGRPLQEDGVLLLPIEAVVRAVGGSVVWDGQNRAIRVATQGQVASAPSTAGTGNSPAPGNATTQVYTPVPVYTPAPVYTSTPVPAYTPTAVNTPASIYTPSTTPTTGAPGSGASVTVAPYQVGSGSVYVPRSVQNSVFAVTVTNIERVTQIKNYYHPRPGYSFVIVYLSQQNVSNEVQIYTGRFSLLDQYNHEYDYIEGLSNFWLVILRPYGINFGYLVFEVPVNARPTQLALHALNQAPLTLNLY